MKQGYMYQRGKAGIWTLDFQEPDKNGKTKKKTVSLKTSDKKEAEKRRGTIMATLNGFTERVEWLNALVRLGEASKAELDDILNKKHSVKISEGWQAFLDSKRRSNPSEDTLKVYKHQYMVFTYTLKDTEASMRSVTCEMAEAHIRFLESLDKKGQTVQKHINTLRMVWDALEPYHNPWTRLRTTKRKEVVPARAFTYEEVQGLLSFDGCELRMSVMIAYYTGLRRKDIFNLKWDNIRWSESVIRVVVAKTGKTLVIPMSEQLHKELSSFHHTSMRAGGTFEEVFCGYEAEFGSKRLKRACQLYNIIRNANGKVGFHSFRKTFVTMMDEIGAPVHVTNSITGHDNGSMHQRYSQVDVEVARDWVNKLKQL